MLNTDKEVYVLVHTHFLPCSSSLPSSLSHIHTNTLGQFLLIKHISINYNSEMCIKQFLSSRMKN